MASSMEQLFFSNIQVAFFPSWVNAFVNSALTLGMRAFVAYGIPYCEHMKPVYNHPLSGIDSMAAVCAAGNPSIATDYGAPYILMDTSASNRDVIYKAVTCDPGADFSFFPIVAEDSQGALR